MLTTLDENVPHEDVYAMTTQCTREGLPIGLAFALGAARDSRLPRVHGNGFIQLDLTSRVRLHFWGHPDIPRQTVETPIHDHVFGFESTILLGRLTNISYMAVPCSSRNASHDVHQAQVRHGEDTILTPTGRYVMLAVNSARCYLPRQCYHMVPGAIHESVPSGPSASVIRKGGPTLAQGSSQKPSVFVPHGLEPDNHFDRYAATETELWRIIDAIMMGVTR